MKKLITIIALAAACPAWADHHKEDTMETPGTSGPDLVVELRKPMVNEVVVSNVGQTAASASVVAIGCAAITLVAEPPTERCVTGAEYSDYSMQGMNTVARLDVPALAAGEKAKFKIPYWRDMQLKEEIGYKFLIRADSENQVDESNEDNNQAEALLGDAPASR